MYLKTNEQHSVASHFSHFIWFWLQPNAEQNTAVTILFQENESWSISIFIVSLVIYCICQMLLRISSWQDRGKKIINIALTLKGNLWQNEGFILQFKLWSICLFTPFYKFFIGSIPSHGRLPQKFIYYIFVTLGWEKNPYVFLTFLGVLFKIYFNINKTNSMFPDDWQYPQHLPKFLGALSECVPSKIISQTGIPSDYPKWYLEFCSHKCDEALNDFK